MRRGAIALALGLLAAACRGGTTPPPLESEKQRLGYSIGYQVGSDFRRQRVELRTERVVEGALDALEENDPALSAAEMRRALADLRRQAEETSPHSTD